MNFIYKMLTISFVVSFATPLTIKPMEDGPVRIELDRNNRILGPTGKLINLPEADFREIFDARSYFYPDPETKEKRFYTSKTSYYHSKVPLSYEKNLMHIKDQFAHTPLLYLMAVPDENVLSACITTKGNHLVTASGNTIKIWEITYPEKNEIAHDMWHFGHGDEKTLCLIASCKCIRTLTKHTDVVESVCLSDNDRFIISGSLDKTIKIWDIKTGDCVETFYGYIPPHDPEGGSLGFQWHTNFGFTKSKKYIVVKRVETIYAWKTPKFLWEGPFNFKDRAKWDNEELNKNTSTNNPGTPNPNTPKPFGWNPFSDMDLKIVVNQPTTNNPNKT